MKRILGAALALACSAGMALAQAQCGPLDGALAHFRDNYGERLVMRLEEEQRSLFVLVNDQTQSWTMLAVNEEANFACYLASGNGVPVAEPIGWAL